MNAVTLLDVEGSPASVAERNRLLPVVRFSVEQRVSGKSADYWDQATMLELDVLESNETAARGRLESALAAVRESWEPRTTAANLRLIAEARRGRGEPAGWLDDLIAALEDAGRR